MGRSRNGDSRCQSATTYRSDDDIKAWLLLKHFEANRPLPSNHLTVVKWVDEFKAAFFGEPERMARCIHNIGARKLNGRPEVACAGDLDKGGVLRHHDGCFKPQQGPVVRDALRVVASRHCNHTGARRNVEKPIPGTPALKGSRVLQILEFEENGGADNLGKRLGVGQRRALNCPAESNGCVTNVIDGHRWRVGHQANVVPHILSNGGDPKMFEHNQRVDRTITANVSAPLTTTMAALSDLTTYPSWLGLVSSAESSSDNAWLVTLRARLGPLARSKRLRMVRTALEDNSVRFERSETDGRDHAQWVLDATVESTGETSCTARVHLHYGGALWTAPLEIVLASFEGSAGDRLSSYLADPA